MKRRQAPSDAAGIPGELYYGIPRGAFHFYGDDPRSIEESGRRHRWADEVRDTVTPCRACAEPRRRMPATKNGSLGRNARRGSSRRGRAREGLNALHGLPPDAPAG